MKNGNILLTKSIWREHFSDWHITDCAVRDNKIVYVCMRKNLSNEESSSIWDHDIPTRCLLLSLSDWQDVTWGARTVIGYNHPLVGVARKPLSQGLLVARNNDGQVSLMGGGRKFPDEFIAPGQIPFTERVKCINGYAYSIGSDRTIYKRTDIGKWELFADLSEERYDGFRISDYGFNDMDAFSETDMYAVGGRGDVWHFDGKIWVQQGFPTNVQLGTVTCAGDGYVYVSGEGGTLWRGRLSTWECIYEGNSTVLWNDALWFEDKLWLSSDYQARIWDGEELVPITHNGEQVPIYGHMDAYSDSEGGLLVIASPDVVMAYDGEEWRILVAPYDSEDDEEEEDDDDDEDE